MVALRRNVGLINSKGFSKLFPVSQSPLTSPPMSQSTGPFSSLVICVTDLSKDARKQVKEATERLGGENTPHLHLRCTHLVVQSSCGRKFEHTLKHGPRNGLFVVTIGWFVDSVKSNLRMSESLFTVKQLGQTSEKVDDVCPVFDLESVYRPRQIQLAVNFGTTMKNYQVSSGTESGTSEDMNLADHSMYVDSDVSDELRLKVLKVAGDKEQRSLIHGSLVAMQVLSCAKVLLSRDILSHRYGF